MIACIATVCASPTVFLAVSSVEFCIVGCCIACKAEQRLESWTDINDERTEALLPRNTGANSSMHIEMIRSEEHRNTSVYQEDVYDRQHYFAEEQTYSLMVRDDSYFSAPKQQRYEYKEINIRIEFADFAQLHVVPMISGHGRVSFVHYVAERTVPIVNSALHILVHNPMREKHLGDILYDFQKGTQKENLLMIIWPEIHAFNACFESPQPLQSWTIAKSRCVSPICDLGHLLVKVTSGLLPKIVFVMPFQPMTQNNGNGSIELIWNTFACVLGEDCCHLHGVP